jgi:hypothetical protein
VVRELSAITPVHISILVAMKVMLPQNRIYLLHQQNSAYSEKVWQEDDRMGRNRTGKPGYKPIVQYWSHVEYAKEAVKKGAKIIMSPATEHIST